MGMQLNLNTPSTTAHVKPEVSSSRLSQPTVAMSSGITNSLPAQDSVSLVTKTAAVSAENRIAAAAQITNSEMAQQVAVTTQDKILEQPATAVSAQARQSNADVLQILQPTRTPEQ